MLDMSKFFALPLWTGKALRQNLKVTARRGTRRVLAGGGGLTQNHFLILSGLNTAFL